MKTLFRRVRSSVRRTRFSLNVMMLEGRQLLATAAGTAPPVNLTTAQIDALGQQLANFVKRFDPTNGVSDLKNVANAINNQINQQLAHPSHNSHLQQALLQIDVDNLAIVDQAINDLAPPPPPPPTGGPPILA